MTEQDSKAENPYLSVIVPCYNVEEFVEDCLDSVIQQSFDGLELIVIDDASTDGTWERMSKYADLPFSLFVRLEANVGLGAVRNKGIKLARGEYLLFLDSDDWLADGALPALLHAAKKTRADLIFFDFSRVHKTLWAVPSPCARLYASVSQTVVDHAEKIRLLDCPTMAWFKLYRREFVMTSGVVFGTGLYEDVSWSYPLTMLADRIQVLPRVLYCYRQRQGSILNKQDSRHLDLVAEYDALFAHCEQLGDDDYTRKIIAKAVAHYVFILFIRSDRLSWSGLKAFFSKAHQQLARFECTEVDAAVAGLPGSPIKRRVLLGGSPIAFFVVFGAVKVSRFIKSPFFLYKTYSSSRPIPDWGAGPANGDRDLHQ